MYYYNIIRTASETCGDGQSIGIYSASATTSHHPSTSFCNLPDLNAACVSSFPPTCSPATNTFGTVLCPDFRPSADCILLPSFT
mmetsp:Transcript_49126/g.147898  ORF Transcript_49126/g.147898 Transcript_49126/m.147898 type:complete len:84 (-) Transcript_49126:374-625(-)